MNKTILLWLMTSVFITIGCKKDQTPAIVKSYPSTIQIGGSNVTITDFTTTSFTELDVNSDGINDFSFNSGFIPGGSLSYIYSASVEPLHSHISILYEAPTDTLYRGTLITIDGLAPSIFHTTYDYIGPENKPGTSVYQFVNPNIADYKTIGDNFQISSSFSSASVLLNYHHVRQDYGVTSVSGDTTYQVGFYHEAIGDYYGNDPFRYVGFKLIESTGEERLGWIKLRVTNHYQLAIFQVGLLNSN